MILAESATVFEQVMNTVIERTITLDDFAQLQRHTENSLQLCSLFSVLDTKVDDLKLAFDQRGCELNAYITFVAEVSEFWQICKTSFKGK